MPLYTEEEYEKLKNILDEIRDIIEEETGEYPYGDCSYLPTILRHIFNGN